MSRLRRRVYRLLDPVRVETLGERAVNAVILAFILASALAVTLETVDRLFERYQMGFFVFEVISVTVFTVEYLLRLWSAPESSAVENPVVGRVRYALSVPMLIDLLAIAPFYVGLVGVGGALDLRFLRALRLFRFLRVLKLVRYSESARALTTVIDRKRDDLVVALTTTTVLLLVASSAMYFIEHEAQPEAFSSIPATLWWGVVTLTTVGYGDVFPVTPAGKFLAAVVAFLGIGLFALPASILASGLVEAAVEDDADGSAPAPDRDRDDRVACPDCGHEFTPLPGDRSARLDGRTHRHEGDDDQGASPRE